MRSCTSGQPFVMAFQAASPHAQDRALESVVAALVEQRRVPASVVWEKPGRDAPLRMQKDYRVVPRGLALVVCCNTFPTWNTYPGLFASLACGNPVLVKPARGRCCRAISVEIAREVLPRRRLRPGPGQLLPEAGARGGQDPAERPGSPSSATGDRPSGAGSEQAGAARGAPVFTEEGRHQLGRRDSTDNLRGRPGQSRLLVHALHRPDVHHRRMSASPRPGSAPTRATCPSTSSPTGWRPR